MTRNIHRRTNICTNICTNTIESNTRRLGFQSQMNNHTTRPQPSSDPTTVATSCNYADTARSLVRMKKRFRGPSPAKSSGKPSSMYSVRRAVPRSANISDFSTNTYSMMTTTALPTLARLSMDATTGELQMGLDADARW